MLKRTITGLVILILCAGFTALRLISPFFFDGFSLVIIYGCLVEMNFSTKLYNKRSSKSIMFIYPIALFAVFALFPMIESLKGKSLVLVVLILLLCFGVLMVKELIENGIKRRIGETEKDEKLLNESLLNETKDTISILIYPTTLLGFLMGINHMGLGLGFVGIIMIFAISMMTDVFAYLFGRMLGKRKMAPEISPNKTVAGMIFGFVGGLIAGGLGLWLFYFEGWFGAAEILALPLWKAITLFAALGVIGSLLTQMGDLVASSIKRKIGIKDFGSIFPGHGGFMDRVDGLMFTTTLVYLLFSLII